MKRSVYVDDIIEAGNWQIVKYTYLFSVLNKCVEKVADFLTWNTEFERSTN